MMKLIILLLLYTDSISCSWESWWSYEGISGPEFWGLIYPQWQVCSKGKRQSPINIETNKLLYDPTLGDFEIDGPNVNGLLQNTGRSLEFKMTDDAEVMFSGGPLSYKYQFEGINIHYGLSDPLGSEHQINGKHFSGEIQFYGYNKELYRNMTEAREKPLGVVVVSVMVKIGDMTSRSELRLLTSALTKVAYTGTSHSINDLSITALLPETKKYMTYEGSLTEPGCWESAVWVIYNQPIYMTKQEMYVIRRLMEGTKENPKDYLGNNSRKIQPSVVTVRTNIEPKMGIYCNCSYTYTSVLPENLQTDDLVIVNNT
ncbi:carbonic anhydrase-related protein 10-like [Aricia agestis]|uniref:carbonic anhydrase-related protein 10-like n=1 Tax=Aricia agestis TaxID=91739 RepID=UPI001C202A78|nr:carbonic anhydrase-related protein 10-like [Aricia agestis]